MSDPIEALIASLDNGKASGHAAETEPVSVDLDLLPGELRELIEADAKLKNAWLSGAKLGKGKDLSPKGLEFSLVIHLAAREVDDELIETAIRHYPYGPIGAGKLAGVNADRHIKGLLRRAEKTREKARLYREAAAWFEELVTSSQEGGPRDCLANGAIILRKDEAFAGKLRFDEHRGAVICRDMPWRPGGAWREWSNVDDLHFAEWCQQHQVPLRPTTCADAVAAVADGASFHPIREFLEGLAWDGTLRLSAWLEIYLGVTVPARGTAEEGAVARARLEYVREVGRRWLISAVARIYRPGCKVDCALILEGPQGAGKSSALEALVPNRDWFADEISDLGSKDAAQDLRGKWIIELAELSALKRGDIERTKSFMSRCTDHYRPSYGRRSQDFPRQCVFAGTTNADAYLGDETGNRRFWSIKVGTIKLELLRQDRDQLWAEAVAAFKAGEQWWLSLEVEEVAALEQADRRMVDPWEPNLLEWAAHRINPVTVQEALESLSVPKERWDQMAYNRVARIFRGAGWTRVKLREGTARRWAYRAPVPVPEEEVPVSPANTGTRKLQESQALVGAGPTGPSGPTSSDNAQGERTHGGWSSAKSSHMEKSGSNRDQWDHPAWHDDQAWLARVRDSRGGPVKVNEVLAWGKAAGGRVDTVNELITLHLPVGLPNRLALRELERVARDCHVIVQMEARA